MILNQTSIKIGSLKGISKHKLLSRHCGRVVKAMDLKSIGFSHAGSNPANVVFYPQSIHSFLSLFLTNQSILTFPIILNPIKIWLRLMNSVTKITATINWFPGHMRKALRTIEDNCKNVDVFLEIRDARIPFSSKNS